MFINKPSSGDDVEVYMYRTQQYNGNGCIARWASYRKVTEFYIPSLQIGFNQHEIGTMIKPGNNKHGLYGNEEPITVVFINKNLINKIQSATENPSKFNNLKQEADFNSLFMTKLRISSQPENSNQIIIKKEDKFWPCYRLRGNSALKKALIQYIMDNSVPIDATIPELCALLKELKPVEKESLLASIADKTQLHNNQFLSGRVKALNKVEDNTPGFWTKTGFAGVVGFASITVTGFSPVAGLANAGLSFFLQSCAEKVYKNNCNNSVNNLWNGREQRAREITEHLNTNHSLPEAPKF